MRTIPQIRERLYQIALAIGGIYGEELKSLAQEMKRRPAVRRTSLQRLEFSESKRAEVIDYAREFPECSYHEISLALNVSVGRVSETLAGKRA